jgi:hypothetical protein
LLYRIEPEDRITLGRLTLSFNRDPDHIQRGQTMADEEHGWSGQVLNTGKATYYVVGPAGAWTMPINRAINWFNALVHCGLSLSPATTEDTANVLIEVRGGSGDEQRVGFEGNSDNLSPMLVGGRTLFSLQRDNKVKVFLPPRRTSLSRASRYQPVPTS